MKSILVQVREQKLLAIPPLRRLAKLLSISGDWELHGQICDLLKKLTEYQVEFPT